MQVVADGASVITLPGFNSIVLTCQGSTGIGPFYIPPVVALQERLRLQKGNPLVKEP